MDFSKFGAIAARIGNSGSPDRLMIGAVEMVTTTYASSGSDLALLPEATRNAANADKRTFLLTAADVAAMLKIDPMTLETQSGTYRGSVYNFLAVSVRGAGGTVALVAYRAPADIPTAHDTEQNNFWAYVTPP